MSQLLAASLGVSFDRIAFGQADTDRTPLGGGHGGSRGLELGGNAVQQAADEVIEKAKDLASHLPIAVVGYWIVDDFGTSRRKRCGAPSRTPTPDPTGLMGDVD